MKTKDDFAPTQTTPATSLTRRRFLQVGLGAAAAVPFLPAASGAHAPEPAETPQPSTGRKIKLGVVGCGGRGAWIAGLFRQHGGYEMWGVADYFETVAQRCGDSLGVDKVRRFSGLSGYKRLIDSGIEAIALETPPYCFPEHARAAVQAGLHVYMAKPVAVDVPGTLSIQESAAKATAAKKVFLVDYQIPTDPQNLQVFDLIRAGDIGDIVALNSHYFAGPFGDPPHTETIESRLQNLIWCNDVALGGGYHNNACIHAIQAALWLAGSRAVNATGYSVRARNNPHGDSHDVFQLVLELENGVLLSHRGKHLDNLTGFEVICTATGRKGYANVSYGGPVMAKGPENGCGGDVADLYAAGAVRNIAQFHRCVLENNVSNGTVQRAIDSALATILGREAGLRRTTLSMKDLLRENKKLEADLRGLKA